MPKKPVIHSSSHHGEMMSPSSMGSPASPTVLKAHKPSMSARDKRQAESRQFMPDGTAIPFAGKEIHHNRLDTHAAQGAVTDFEHAIAEDIFDKFFFTDDLTTSAADAEQEVRQPVGVAPTELIDQFKTTIQNDGYHFLGAAMAAVDLGLEPNQQKRATLADAAQAAFVEAHKGAHGGRRSSGSGSAGQGGRSNLKVDQSVTGALTRRTSKSRSNKEEDLRRGTV